jgi:hypothetical protein
VEAATSRPLAIDLEKFRSKGGCQSGSAKSVANLAPFLQLQRRYIGIMVTALPTGLAPNGDKIARRPTYVFGLTSSF